MRTAGRVVAWIGLVVAGLATLLFVAVAIDNDGDSDLIVGGLALAAVSAGAGFVAWIVQRNLGRPATATDETSEQQLERAARGETVELHPSRLKWALVF